MQIKLRKVNQDGLVRVETSGDIKEVLINEDFLHPDAESISICFKGKNSSGIIDISPAEFDQLYETVKDRMHLIKGLQRFSGGGARRL
jgi:hypothetical protein